MLVQSLFLKPHWLLNRFLSRKIRMYFNGSIQYKRINTVTHIPPNLLLNSVWKVIRRLCSSTERNNLTCSWELVQQFPTTTLWVFHTSLQPCKHMRSDLSQFAACPLDDRQYINMQLELHLDSFPCWTSGLQSFYIFHLLYPLYFKAKKRKQSEYQNQLIQTPNKTKRYMTLAPIMDN